MKILFTGLSVIWALLCVAKLVLIFEDIDALETQNLDNFISINLGSACIALASLILMVLYYTSILPFTNVLVTTIVTTFMSFGYLITWLSFGTNLTLIVTEHTVDLSQTQGGLSPYVLLDCLLICVQLAMVTREAIWFLITERLPIADMDQGHPLSTLINTVIFIAMVTSILQLAKIMVIGSDWPLSNDATTVFGLLSAISTLCNMVIYMAFIPILTLDLIRATAAIVFFVMAHLLIWASVGSAMLMMDIDSKQSYDLIFGLDVFTGVAHIVVIALLQYLAHNLYALAVGIR